MPAHLKHKPQNKPILPPRPPKQPKCTSTQDTPRTTAQPEVMTQQNLTLFDWLTVYAYINAYPAVTQGDVVRHFTTLKTGKLIFNQSTLSQKL
jgi:hypothetical protein